jgi:hypothetical protein
VLRRLLSLGIYHRPGFKKHLMFQDVTAKYCIYDKVPSLPMSFFVRIKGYVNCCTTTSVCKKTRINALICLVTGSFF